MSISRFRCHHKSHRQCREDGVVVFVAKFGNNGRVRKSRMCEGHFLAYERECAETDGWIRLTRIS